MEWYCCNGCFTKANKETYFFLTSCLHIFCEKCFSSKCFDKCLICNDSCKFFKINSTLHPSARIYFSDLSSMAYKLEKEIETFTATKQQEAISFAKQKISIFRQVIQFQLEQTNTFFKKSQFDPEKVQYLIHQINKLNQEVAKFKTENQELRDKIWGLEKSNFSIKSNIFDSNVDQLDTETFQFRRNYERKQSSAFNYMLNQPSSSILNNQEVNSTNIILINQPSTQVTNENEFQFSIPKNHDQEARALGSNVQEANNLKNLLNESKFVYKTPCNTIKNPDEALVKNQAVSSVVSRSSIAASPTFSDASIKSSAQQFKQVQLPVQSKPNSIKSLLLELKNKKK